MSHPPADFSSGTSPRTRFTRMLRDYGMLGVLLLLGGLFSVLTLADQHPTGVRAASALANRLARTVAPSTSILVVCRETPDDSLFAQAAQTELSRHGFSLAGVILGEPAVVRDRLARLADSLPRPGVIATLQSSSPIIQTIKSHLPGLASVPVVTPPSQRWPTFLLPDNLRNVANQIAVIAILAVGMTMVIITAGIDLSVGSLIALSAVVVAWLIGNMGSTQASTAAMVLAALGAIVLCGAIGAFSGLMITGFRIPPFIATLAMMQVTAGLAYIISHGMPIYQLPERFIWLGRGAEPLLKIPHAVILMVVLYLAAHVLMTRTTMGRYIYAVGGNMEAARLAGIRVRMVLFFVYTVCGALAGLGGVVMASQLKSGAPTYGLTYELYVIAAVVVGGTSLSGGEGRILGTLIGALVIAVIQNGMNLTNVESYTQKVVLGLVILAAVLLDRLKHRGFTLHKWRGLAKSRSADH